MSLADVRSARSSPTPDACPECDTGASVTSDLHKYQVACTCKPASAQYACADDPGPPGPVKTDTPPALPPRPPTSVLATNRRNNASVGCNGNETTCRRRKYAWWCCGCGALAAALGGLLAAQHILLRSYTASPHHLETVPAAVPAAMLVLTGFCIMSLARRRNRYSYMIKVVGAFCLVCALTCVLVTITTTVIHMNKLQTLKFCEYTKLTRTCTCYSLPPDLQHSGNDDDGVRCVFEDVTDCGVVHGALYWCLRGVFALSVSAVLVCIFSCMLAYQLLRARKRKYFCALWLEAVRPLHNERGCDRFGYEFHERKKMYWEQLELRCRSLYRPPSGQPAATSGRPVQNSCSCCAQCHTTQPAWDFSLQHRFWAPGRIGNLYSPNPGTNRKTSPWSWFPWPRGNSQNSRCRMSGVPQSGDSAYGFCETEQNPNPGQSYDERNYPANFNQFPRQHPNFPQNSANFPQNPVNFPQNPGNYPQSSEFSQNVGNFSQSQYPGGTNFGQSTSFSPGFQEGFGETSGSFDAQTGVWGPPPPYSPQGRNGSRHHLHHQDPAAATLLHHHHIDHRNSIQHETLQHACSRNFLQMQNIPEINRINQESRMNQDLSRLNPDLTRLNPDLNRMNQEMNHMYPNDQDVNLERFNTLRGHLVPYRGCQRLGVSSGNLHRDSREDVAIECLHQKTACKDQNSESCPKLGKENLGFQNDKHSPVRSSIQDCRGVNQNTESEVYFADVSSCCNADCCVNANNMSALVGTIENHPESTSESDTSFTLTRQQRPQPQVGSKRRPKNTEKHIKQDKIRDFNNSVRLTEQQIEHLNNSMRIERMNEIRMSDRINESRESRVNESRDRLNDSRVERLNDSRVERLNDSRVERLNDSRVERSNDSRVERLNDSRVERLNDSRVERLNDSRVERLNDSRVERLNDSRVERLNDSRGDRLNDSRVDRLNDSDRGDPRDRMNDSRDRLNERNERFSDRLNDSRIDRISERERVNESRSERFDDRRMSDLNSSIRIEGSPKMRHVTPLRMTRTSPKNIKENPRQSSSESNKDFFTPNLSPLSPNTEESLLSDDDRNIKPETVYSNEPEVSKCLAPDSQYETVREKDDILKTNHHHCYSDTNTMDSGWQSGSEKQVTD